MKMAEKKLTREESDEIRERQREIALYNLKSESIQGLTAAFYTENSRGYGDVPGDAVDNYIYAPAISSGPEIKEYESGKKVDLIRDNLLRSREGGKRYSGQISEYKIIEDAMKITQDALTKVKVEDIKELINYDGDIPEAYKEKYLSELIESKKAEDKEIFAQLITAYMDYLGTTKVAEALNKRAEAISGSLERILTEEEIKG